MTVKITLTETVDHLAYDGTQRDSRGNVQDSWADPVTVPANWYVASTQEPQIAGHDRVRVDAQVFIPDDLVVGSRDRFTLPSRDGMWEVIGEVEDYNHGPFSQGWPRVVNLRKVTG